MGVANSVDFITCHRIDFVAIFVISVTAQNKLHLLNEQIFLSKATLPYLVFINDVTVTSS